MGDLNIKASSGSRLEKENRNTASKGTQGEPFDDQLNKQVDQIREPVKAEKIEKNQMDNNELREDERGSAESEVGQTDGMSEQPENNMGSPVLSMSTELDSENGTENLDQNPLPDAVESDRLLPLEGEDLPLLVAGPQAGAIAEASGAGQGKALNASPRIASLAELENIRQLNTGAREASLQQPGRADSLPAESMATKGQLGGAQNNLEKNRFQFLQNTVASDDALSSEKSVSEMISQAARAQQVPGLSSSVASSATMTNMNALLTAENTTSVNNVTPLTSSSALSGGGLNSVMTAGAISAGINSPEWSQQMTQQVSLMLKGGFQQAEIRLNPAHLGPMEIKLSVKDDKASISFVAPQAPVRDAIDSAMPRLREMLEQQGLNLAEADVSSQSGQGFDEPEQSATGGSLSMANEQSDGISVETVDPVSRELNIRLDSGLSIFA